MYLEHTGAGVKTLLVTNYAQLENIIGEVFRGSREGGGSGSREGEVLEVERGRFWK